MRVLVPLLLVVAAYGFKLAAQPLTPVVLACWTVALWAAGWILRSIWEALVAPPRPGRSTPDE